ncbi:MAG: DUF6531 domain-containing protein [Solirubrobacteraceae bacterium]
MLAVAIYVDQRRGPTVHRGLRHSLLGDARSRLGLAFGIALAVLAVVPAGASAEPLCTDNWTGPSEGAWQTASNWSTGKAPGSSDVVCIEAGRTVKVTGGTNQAGVLEDKGTVVIAGATLELVSALEVSRANVLTMEYGAVLTGAATLDVASSLSWSVESTMSGSGLTVIQSGASASITAHAKLVGRTLVNEGTLALEEETLTLSECARVENKGTFDANTQSTFGIDAGDTSSVRFVNSGTFQKTGGIGETRVEVNFENKGTVNGKTGTLVFRSAEVTVTLAGGSVLEGTVSFLKASIAASGFSSPSGTVALRESPMTIEAGSTVKIKNLVMEYGSAVTGAGTLDLLGTFAWSGESTMSGTGSTVVQSGASASITAHAKLAGRKLVNESTFTLGEGMLTESEGATVENNGTFDANGQEVFGIYDGGVGAAARFVNTGVFQKTEGTGETRVEINFENNKIVEAQKGKLRFSGGGSSTGTWSSAEGAAIVYHAGSYVLNAGSWTGAIELTGATVSVENLESKAATVTTEFTSTLDILKGSMTIPRFSLGGGCTLTGAGTLDITSSLTWAGEGTMSGKGETVIQYGATALIAPASGGLFARLVERKLLNEGTAKVAKGYTLYLSEGATIDNEGIFEANTESLFGVGMLEEKIPSYFINNGLFEKTEGTEETRVGVNFENNGIIAEPTGKFKFLHPAFIESATQYGLEENPSSSDQSRPECGEGVDCATGNFSQSQTDLSVGGRGVGLDLTRTYNSQAAVAATEHGMFGYGWTSSFSDHLVVEKANKKAILFQAEGSTVPFTEGSGESFIAPSWSQDTLSGSAETGYTLTLANQTKYKFTGSNGRLESVTDRNGNATTLTYNEGRLEKITDPAGRAIKLTYNGEGLVESAEDPMKHVVKYTYKSGNLASVTQPGGAALRWQFEYDASHQMTELTDGRSGHWHLEYNSSHKVTFQKDPAERQTTFEYEAFQTKTTNKATGAVTDERFDSNDLPFSTTHGYGTSAATTETFSYNSANCLLSATDGDGHTTKYTYDSSNNRRSKLDAEEHETKWTYDSTHDIETETLPNGETTTYKRDSHGNPEVIERPAPGSTTQSTSYKYTSHGQLESMTDPLKRTWKYEYDTAGDKTTETDPESDKRTWGYNEDSQETSMVSPRGHVSGAKESEFTTTTERDAQGRPIKVTDPLGHETKTTYDGDGNVEMNRPGDLGGPTL